MVIRESRAHRAFDRVLLQRFHCQLHSFFELHVYAFAPSGGIEVNVHVGRRADVFDFPLAFGCIETEVRRGDVAAIHQRGIAADADQTAPGAFADDRADLFAFEHPGQEVTTRTGVFIRQHDFWPRHYAERSRRFHTFAHSPVTDDLFAQVVNDVIGRAAAAVEAFVNHRAFFVELREVVAIEIRVAAVPRVRQINVSQFAAAQFSHLAAIGFDPIVVAQCAFVTNGNDGDITRAGAVGVGADPDDDLLTGCAFEQLIDVVRRGQIAAFDGQDIFACDDVDAGLREFSPL
jgi:hypothetical protein